jgi:protein-tyrosine phosphatase
MDYRPEALVPGERRGGVEPPRIAARDTLDAVIATPQRHLPLDGTRNVRDVGGYPAGAGRRTRWRTLLRSDELTGIPVHAQQQLLELGVRQVVDLRWPEELAQAPNAFRASPDVRYTSVPLLADDPTPHAGLAGMYRHVFDARAPQLAEVVRALLPADGLPVVIGCAAGKDRTGVTIALLLDLAGVPTDVIVEDYARSAGHFETVAASVASDDWRHLPLTVESPPEYMADALRHLDAVHGGSRALLRRQGLTDAELDALVERITEPGLAEAG